MHIAFYAALKPPDHPVPSGDRLIARQVVAALTRAGHRVAVVSTLRARLADSAPATLAGLAAAAAEERRRIAAGWAGQGPPDLWLTYHVYYRSPDLVGPPLAAEHAVPSVTLEASYASRRDAGEWAAAQGHVAAAVRQAHLNISFVARDRDGLAGLVGPDRLALLDPFIDADGLPARLAQAGRGPVRLVALAMMRDGHKAESYRFLAAALARLGHLDWRLSVIGNGPARTGIEAALTQTAPGRVRFLGALDRPEALSVLARSDLLVWPGVREPMGMVYLEAQAIGLPVVATSSPGAEAMLRDGDGGLLSPPGDVEAYARAIARMIVDPALRDQAGARAMTFARGERGLATAAARLDALLARVTA